MLSAAHAMAFRRSLRIFASSDGMVFLLHGRSFDVVLLAAWAMAFSTSLRAFAYSDGMVFHFGSFAR